MSTDSAIEELKFRGLDATNFRIEQYCRDPNLSPPMIGGVRSWNKATIDKIDQAMEKNEKLMPPALYRKEKDLSWAEQMEMLHRHNEAKREVTHADDE